MTQKDNPFHYVQIDEKLCNGCVLCMKACPTKAIRVRDGRVARIVGVCIDCGECVRVCPRGAIKANITEFGDQKDLRYSAISASAVLYTQFGKDVMPNDVLLALAKWKRHAGGNVARGCQSILYHADNAAGWARVIFVSGGRQKVCR